MGTNAPFGAYPKWATDASGNATGLVGPGGGVSIQANSKQVVLFPSGDTSGATDYVNVSQYLTAAVAKDIYLSEGDWYFNNTLVRMPRRNSDNTNWNFSTTLGRSTDALIPDFFGAGAHKTRLHFTDVSKPAMYLWRPPSGISGGPTSNVRSRANSSDTSNDPRTVGGGVTAGFTIMGATSPYYTTSDSYFSLDNEARWPNHIGISIWGSHNIHSFKDISIRNFGTGLVLHDTTNLEWNSGSILTCDIGIGLGIQSDMNVFNGVWTETCRIGVALVWEGWQTGTYTSATYAGIGRESGGSYLTYTGCDNDLSKFDSCVWGHCAQAAIAGHSNIANTVALDNYSLSFNSCHWESNASIFQYFRNVSAACVEFNSCSFRGLGGADVVGAYTYGNLAAQTGSLIEILRHWIVGRVGVSQNTANTNFGQFWGYGISEGDFVLRNCRMDATVYPFVCAKSNIIVRWEHNYSPFNGTTQFPTIAADISDANSKGCRVKTNEIMWNTANSQDWNSYFIQSGFAADFKGVMTGITTGVSLPSATSALRGQNRTIIGGAGVADATYQCMKSIADTYSWKLITLG